MSTWPLLYMRYLAIPARAVPLSLVIAFAFGFTLASAGGLIGLPLALILLSWTFKYGFITFDAVSRGFAEPPVLAIEMVNPANEQRPLAMLLIVGVFYAATSALAQYAGAASVSVLRFAALLLLPASIVTLGITGRLIDAVNPRLLVTFAGRLGRDYLLLLAGIALCWGLSQYVASFELWFVAQAALQLFLLYALFCLMGGIVYERREALGMDAWEAPERTQARAARARERAFDRELDEIYAHCRAGSYDQAWADLHGRLDARNHDFEAYREYHARLAHWPDPRLVDRLAKEWVSRHGARAAVIVAKPGA